MRIALITPGFSANTDDWAIPALQTLAQAVARKHDLYIFSLRYPAAGRSEWGDFIHQAIGGGQRYGLASLAIWRKTLTAVIKQHRQTPFDVLHAFWADEPGLVAALAGMWVKRPVVVSIGGGELTNLPDINYGTQRSSLRSRIIRLSFRKAGAVTAGSNYQLALARHHGLNRAKDHLIPLGVDTDHFRPTAIPAWERPSIVQAASLTPVKNQSLLLETVALIKKELPNIRLCIAGDGPLRPKLEYLAKSYHLENQITFTGAVPYPEMPQFFHQGHLYLQTSRHESQGMSVLEAMACGLPILGTPVGVTAELAAMPAASEPETLAVQAIQLLRDPALYKRHRQQARQQVVEGYRLDNSIQCYLDLYHQLSRHT